MKTAALTRLERSVPIGPRRLRREGWHLKYASPRYTVAPISLLRAEVLVQALVAAVEADAASAEELAKRFVAAPVELVRALAPLLTQAPPDPRHLAGASDAQLRDLAAAFLEVNDVEAILGGLARLAVAGLTIADLALRLGQAFHLWPRAVLEQPAQAVFAVADELDLFTPKPKAPQAPAVDLPERVDGGETFQ